MAHQDPRDLTPGSQGRGYAQRVSLALPAWLRHPSDRTKDIALVAALAVPVVGRGIADAGQHDRPWLALLAAVSVAALLLRRRWPFAALAIIVGAVIAASPNGATKLPVLVALYAIASTRPWRASAIVVAILVAASLLDALVDGSPVGVGDEIGFVVQATAVVAVGLYVAARRASIDALRERAERLDRERELLADRAVAEERVRIAQELHDVVAHNVSLIVVKAQALGATVPDDRVAEATDGIADLGRQAMTEMHRTLKLLRTTDDDAAQRSPQPGLANLDMLLDQARAAGLDVRLAVEGEPRELSQSLDLSAFRIVQEALTNVLKHAGQARANVTVGYRTQALELSVVDSGNGTPTPARGLTAAGGHGLVGMRERAAMFGGTLSARPRADRGFEVNAVLPYSGGRDA
jgi:signal transduction histidine kinase